MWDSWWISATKAELIHSYLQVLLLVSILSLLHTYLFLRCATVLTRQHLITPSVFNLGSSTLSQYLAAHWVRNFSALRGGTRNTRSEQWGHVTLCSCSYVTAEHAASQHRNSTRQMTNWPTWLLSACMVKLKIRNICKSQQFKTCQKETDDHFTAILTAHQHISIWTACSYMWSCMHCCEKATQHFSLTTFPAEGLPPQSTNKGSISGTSCCSILHNLLSESRDQHDNQGGGLMISN